jgi:uncharacterized damage-inducible protein DinB
MIVNTGFIRTMAAYNADMNERLYSAADRLDDAVRRADRGAFWHSIHETLCHILWGDQIWMSRFDGWDKPAPSSIGGSDMILDFAELRAARRNADAKISAWATRMNDAWLAQDLTWFSGAAGREFTMARGILVVHFFNHQTHHRGQAHALITAAGEATGDTDLFLLPDVVAVALTG